LIRFTGLPFPPTSNHQYVSFVRGGKVRHAASKGLTLFNRDMNVWALKHAPQLAAARVQIGEWIRSGMTLDVRVYLGFDRSKIMLKDGSRPKKVDASNRLKAIHDALADSLGIDDSIFWSVTAEKMEIQEGAQECVTVTIQPMKRRRMMEVEGISVPSTCAGE
jgi:Holliday junction resolvase RusA-like endonuclease